MIYTSYFSKRLKSDIVKISIALWPPRDFKGASLPELAPSQEMLHKYKDCADYGNAEYMQDFETILDQLDAELIYKKIEKIAKGHDAALLCYEKTGFCHRHLVGAWLIENDIYCDEY